MTSRERIKFKQRLRYTFRHWKKSGAFDILNDIIESVNLVQLLDTVSNVSHAVSISRDCTFDSNYKNNFYC